MWCLRCGLMWVVYAFHKSIKSAVLKVSVRLDSGNVLNRYQCITCDICKLTCVLFNSLYFKYVFMPSWQQTWRREQAACLQPSGSIYLIEIACTCPECMHMSWMHCWLSVSFLFSLYVSLYTKPKSPYSAQTKNRWMADGFLKMFIVNSH